MKYCSLVFPIAAASIANISFDVYKAFLTNFPDQIDLYKQVILKFRRKSPETVSLAQQLEKNLGVNSKIPIYQLIDYELNFSCKGSRYKGKQDDYINILKFYSENVTERTPFPVDFDDFATFLKFYKISVSSMYHSTQTVINAAVLTITYLCSTATNYEMLTLFYRCRIRQYITLELRCTALDYLGQIPYTHKRDKDELFLPEREGGISLKPCSDKKKYIDKIREKLYSPIDIWDTVWFPCSFSANAQEIVGTISRFRIHVASSISDFNSLVVFIREFDWTAVPHELLLIMKLQVFGESSLRSFNSVYHGSIFKSHDELPLFMSFMSSHLNLAAVADYLTQKCTLPRSVRFQTFSTSLMWLFYQGAALFTPFFSNVTRNFGRIADFMSGIAFEQMYFDIVLLFAKAFIESAAGKHWYSLIYI